MSIEQPRPPANPVRKNNDEVAQLREEVRRLQHDIAFLKQLLEHVRQEFHQAKQR